ncbi:hypothetical protein [Mycolicibacterium frederiksbergense]|uniref:hypothetical protein n=1 Tax=Mycolicibacterium frederiksbergense TaxID=117567 RepID=UPI00399AD308
MKVHIDNPPERLELSPIPNIRGFAAAAEWITDKLGIAVSKDHVLSKSKSGDIDYSVICGARHYSTLALYEYVMSRGKNAAPAKPNTDPWEV